MLSKTVSDILREADALLLSKFEHSDAQYYLRELMHARELDLYTQLDNYMDEDLNKEFQAGITRLLNDEPVAHILGYSWFYGRKFKVDHNVLIPRSETELLVEQTLIEVKDYFHHEHLDVIDVGCGSGVIGISLKLEAPQLNVDMVDISTEALSKTMHNAERLYAEVNVYASDMLSVPQLNHKKYDVIVSNPPYIENDYELDASVSNFEPHLALFGGIEGLDFYREILKQAQGLLKSPGLIAFEIGFNQAEALHFEIHQYFPNAVIKVVQDYAKLDRMVFALV